MPLQNYSIQGLQDELYFNIFDKLAKVTNPLDAPHVIDDTFADLKVKYYIRDYDKKMLEGVVAQLKHDYLAKL